MAWRTIAKKDVREVTDSRTLTWGLGLLVLVCVLGGYVMPINADDPTTADFPTYMADAVGLLVPLLGILLGYNAIVEERSSGRLALLLGLPHSRRDVVLGKLVGRAVPLAAAIALGVAVGGALVVYPFGSIVPGALVGYVAVTLLLGLAFLGIGLAISTLTTSRQLASASAFGAFFAFVIVWPELRLPLERGMESLGLADGGLPDPVLFVHGLEPSLCYDRVVEGFFADDPGGPYADGPWYLGPELALLALLGWATGPIAIGYYRFQVTDL